MNRNTVFKSRVKPNIYSVKPNNINARKLVARGEGQYCLKIVTFWTQPGEP